LATSRDTKKPYALKTILKRQLIDAGQIKGVLREKQIMASIEHPFILPLVGSFQDEDSLYLLLPFNQGGELFNVVHTDQRDGLDNVASQFYGGCILEALGYLHARNIVYRDMKPENALIDKDGYCIMIDFGFAKIVVDKTYTLCGTPEYLAPEIIMSKGHDKAVDYWYVILLLCVCVCVCVCVVSFAIINTFIETTSHSHSIDLNFISFFNF
jgi:protein kinase A